MYCGWIDVADLSIILLFDNKCNIMVDSNILTFQINILMVITLRRAYILLILCLIALLCGCKANVASKSQLIKYAKKNYGEAQCLNYVVEDGKSYVILKDKEYGFEYSVWSYISDFSMDGTKFGEIENKSSNFTKNYIDYMKASAAYDFSNLKKKYNCDIEWKEYYNPNDSFDDILLDIYLSNADDAEKVAKEFYDEIKEFDKRDHFIYGRINIYYNEDIIGEYKFSDNKYMTKEEAEIDWFMKRAMDIMNSSFDANIKSIDEFTYLYMETMDVNNIPGYEENSPRRITDTEESLANTKVHYFKYKDEKWLIADCLAPDGQLYVHKLEQ
ncbi:hypothetical protein Clocl_3486 [Acetivibrio clariflavus DSM 19732]|uniref:Uncharacterized protein n=1 Tax=Acetivibrio clariflavus (strain DSM 19732 / NBRC 101661 / EBR45) TaxID=720554 RepID=G8LYI0_ACECE|nr:hypothetical protein Clocl_3486 [Acetivibrio clariflavus DSM 19732]